jgi:hypothetical protein
VLEETMPPEDASPSEPIVKSSPDRDDMFSDAYLDLMLVNLRGRTGYNATQFPYFSVVNSQTKGPSDV